AEMKEVHPVTQRSAELTPRDSLAADKYVVRKFSHAFPAFSLMQQRHYTENATTSAVYRSHAFAAYVLLQNYIF
ncbi:hypothetical protein COCCADRAFT_113005, partial [Bipolaris zeicola 26-R-13]